ncbi:hypothetical protein MKJ01_03265 [Chryseobacterium sp. SSA4.19]|uniref:hypothetical protein n=1 Tax=Chryseobacterium sp. SSA4.19 TaxID=2919915 RepID=UPI001F4EFB96|nr:hypothetical protein [Chryseobacterium sp. SSA4.19]MCJ8152784.1 hypothetical protein [Chryseobacterium sp. SSA4.19]
MIKKILLGAFCIAQFSLGYANESSPSGLIPGNGAELYQKVPKSVIIKTKKFKIRIDQQPNGKYLYQSWPATGKITSKPSMIISDGEMIPDGTGGNYYFEFNNNGYTYQVWRNYLTDSAKKAPYTLTVYNGNGNTIVNQAGYVIKN